jgi:hypothetical protein
MVRTPLWEHSPGSLAALLNSGTFVQADLVTIKFIPQNYPATIPVFLAVSAKGLNAVLVGASDITLLSSALSAAILTKLSTTNFVAIGYRTNQYAVVATSLDGITWTIDPLADWTRQTGNPYFSVILAGVVSTSSLYVAVGAYFPSGDPVISTSLDGVLWTAQTPASAPGLSLKSIAWNGSLFVAVGWGNGGATLVIMTSPDAITWTSQSVPAGITYNATLSSVAWNGSVWIAVGIQTSGALIITSSDGITWTLQANPFTVGHTVEVNGVACTSSISILVGDDITAGTLGTIMSSTDNGVTWTTRLTTPSTFRFFGVAVNGTNWVAVGVNYTVFNADIYSSPDGVTWTNRSLPVSPIIAGLIAVAGQ